MEKKIYILQKNIDSPNFPFIPKGTEFSKSIYEGSDFAYTSNYNYSCSPDIVEKRKEWFLPKEEKDYEIINCISMEGGSYYGKPHPILPDCLSGTCVPYSVKSLKTNLTWTVGDTTHHNCLIDNFYIKENECWVKIKQRHLEVNDYKLSDLQPVKDKKEEGKNIWEFFKEWGMFPPCDISGNYMFIDFFGKEKSWYEKQQDKTSTFESVFMYDFPVFKDVAPVEYTKWKCTKEGVWDLTFEDRKESKYLIEGVNYEFKGLLIYAMCCNENQPKEKEIVYPKGIKKIKTNIGEIITLADYNITIGYTHWLQLALESGHTIYEVENDKGEVFKVGDKYDCDFGIAGKCFTVSGFTIVDGILCVEYDSVNHHGHNIKYIYKPLTTKEPKAETFETGKVYPMPDWEGAFKMREYDFLNPYNYFSSPNNSFPSCALTFEEWVNANGYDNSVIALKEENAELKQKVEELTKENKQHMVKLLSEASGKVSTYFASNDEKIINYPSTPHTVFISIAGKMYPKFSQDREKDISEFLYIVQVQNNQ